MRRIYENGLSCRSLYPAALRPAAREDELIDFPFFDHAELQIAIEWRGCNRVPIRHGPPFYFQSLYAAERSSLLCDLSKPTSPESIRAACRLENGAGSVAFCQWFAPHLLLWRQPLLEQCHHLNRRDAVKISPIFQMDCI